MSDWMWHEFGRGVVAEVELPGEFARERLLRLQPYVAAYGAVPDPVDGLRVHRGRDDRARVRWPRRPGPLAGAGGGGTPQAG